MSGAPPRVGVAALAAAGAALAGSVAAEALLGARPALAAVPIALDLVCAAVAALAWRAAREPGSAWRALAETARLRPLLAAWLAADAAILGAASIAGFGKLGVEPGHWKAVAAYVSLRALLLSLAASWRGSRRRRESGGSAGIERFAGAAGLAGIALALFSPPLWRAAASAGALALVAAALALRPGALPRLAPAGGVALPGLALGAAAWLSGSVPLSWASPVASASMLLALGLATLALAGDRLRAPGAESAPRARP